MTTFEDLGLSDKVLKAIHEIGWEEPTPVQCAAVPIGFEGRDILAQAQTGTGKTAAYGMIIIGRTPSGLKKPTSLVLCPTRELALQVEQELSKLSYHTRHRVAAIYGGASYKTQFDKLRRGADIIAGTPGRVKDLIEQGVLDISHVREVVLDEADRMLEMGFEEEVNFIMGSLPEKRQTLLFSATLADEIMDLGARFMNDPEKLLVSKDEPCSDLVSQYYIPLARNTKMEKLDYILSTGRPKALVFCQTKKMVDELMEKFSDSFKVGALHGDMPQAKREKVIGNFKKDKISVLIATDVAARGIDVNNIDVVINYDVPPDAETYLHRIGRTGRAGKTGMAVSFVTRMETSRLRRYEDETGRRISKMAVEDFGALLGVRPEPVPERKYTIKSRDNDREDEERPAPKRERRVSEEYGEPAAEKPVRAKRKSATDIPEDVAPATATEEEPVRAKRQPKVADVDEEPVREKKPARKAREDYDDKPVKREKKVIKVVESKTQEERMNMVALKINLGKEDGYGRVQITEMIKKAANIDNKMVGRVGLGSSASFVEVDSGCAEMVISAVSNKSVNGKIVVAELAPDKIPYAQKVKKSD